MTIRHYRPRADRARAWDPDAYDAARVAQGLTWQALSDRLGGTPHLATLHTYSLGRRPPRALVPRIARALRVPQRALTGGET